MKITQSLTAGLLLWLASTLAPPTTEAADILFKWKANTELDLKGYRLYAGTFGTLPNPQNAIGSTNILKPATSLKLPGVPTGRYWFFLTAYTTAGIESAPSNVIVSTVPGAPSGFTGFVKP